MDVVTTPNLEGKRVVFYCGIVFGEAIIGMSAVRDMFANINDFAGGRSAGYEREMKKARETALREIEEHAKEYGANAVLSVDLDYQSIGENNLILVSASGTAVVVEDIAPQKIIVEDSSNAG